MTRKTPKKYSGELGKAICDRISEGLTVEMACEAEGVVKRSFYRWLPVHEQLSHLYRHARACRADSQFDEIETIELSVLAGEVQPTVARVVLESMRWRLSKMVPGKYGDRTTLDVKETAVDRAIDHAPEWLRERLRVSSSEPH